MVAFSLLFPAEFVLHIGAGCGRAAEGYVQAGLGPVVLAGTDPEMLPELQALAQRFKPVQAAGAAVSAGGGAAVLYRCNFPDLSSQAGPAETLFRLFPGLEVQQEDLAQTQAVADLAALCGLPAERGKAGGEPKQGLLVIEAAAQPLALLQALEQAGCLQHFQMLRLQEGHKPLYRGASGMAALQAGLEDLGYASQLEAAPADPDRPYAVAWRNKAAQARAAAQADLQQQLDLCASDLAELQQRYRAVLQEKEAQEDLLRQLAALAGIAGHG
ncbi:hypothetical protein AB838_22165 [Rhodobacteraceae bacterium (ex Bugula neritina AB1)]|nr:hypothetical protein AB838_22165 [Rhodobacteraceae bacterium (ex Bugula neritina AB1)]